MAKNESQPGLSVKKERPNAVDHHIWRKMRDKREEQEAKRGKVLAVRTPESAVKQAGKVYFK
jgi:hypothetical protein